MRCPSRILFQRNLFRCLVFLVLLAALCTGGALAAALSAAPAMTINPNLVVVPAVSLTTQPQTVVCTAPCECMLKSDAVAKWGESGHMQCSETPCGQQLAVAAVAAMPAYKYCFQAKPVRVVTARLPVTQISQPAETVPIVQRRTCATGLTLCNLLNCVNTSTNRNNCGSCGHVCPAMEICQNGQCTVRTVQKRTCAAGLTLCSGLTCVNTNTDGKNCGSCGHTCPVTQVCTNGQCKVPVKALVTQDPCVYQGKTNCGGTCIDTAGSDNNNCGGCGWVCPSGLTCVQGECSLVCPDGQIDCQYNCYDPMTDPDNCGTCGTMCSQGQDCCNGKCVDFNSDSANCGYCGKKCDTAHSQTCMNGFCNCKPGTLLCDPSFGCVDVNYNWEHCGSCGNVCKTPEICIQGRCEFEPSCGTKNYQTNTVATCADGIQNQDETGVDCGGKCPPCNTRCTTGTKYAPADTPCTSTYNYLSALSWVPSSNYPADNYYVYAHYDPCPFCNYPCQAYEVCHPALDPLIQEAAKCCSLTSFYDIEQQMPEPDICKYAVKMAPWSCQKCTGIYLIKELADGTRWMDGYQDETQTDKAKQITNAGGTPPIGTANYLLNFYHIGICHDYALAVTTLLRKAGFSQDDVGSYCDGAHCYNVVRFPGDTKWHVVDTDAPNQGGETWQYGKLQGGYPYCHTMDENSIFYNMGTYFTGPIPDLNAYWTAVNNGQAYQYQQKQPFQPKCEDPYTALPCSIQYGGPPLCGPGVGGVGKDYYNLPSRGVPAEQLVGC